MKKKKKIIVIILTFIVLILGVYISSIIKNADMSGYSCGIGSSNQIINNIYEKNEKKMKLINIQTKLILSENKEGIDLVGGESFFNESSGYKEKEGKVTIEVLNEDGEVIKSESVQTKGETSIWIFLGKGKNCSVRIKGEGAILYYSFAKIYNII